MSSLLGTLSVARQGLCTSQTALSITSQNIANVNTDGYSRQRPAIVSLSQLGGSKVDFIDRVRNGFLDRQRMVARSVLGLRLAKDEALTHIEAILDETNAKGTMGLMNDFFAALQDLSLRPQGLSEREGVRATAVSISRHLHSTRQRLVELQDQNDRAVVSSIETVNRIAQEIASINELTITTSSSGLSANELVDRRNELVNELSEYLPVQTYEEDEGVFTIIIGNGLTLVEGIHHSTLEPAINADNHGLVDVLLRRESGTTLDVTARLDSGRIGGHIHSRDVAIAEQIRNIDLFAAQLITNFNIQHRQGFDLSAPPNTNIDFFEPVSVFHDAPTANTGGAKVTASSLLDQSLLTFDEYEIRFTAANTYDIVDVTTGATLVGGAAYVSGANIDFDGIRVVITDDTGPPAAGDVFQVDTVAGMAATIDISAAIDASLSAIAASSDGVTGDNGNALLLAALDGQYFFSNGTATFNDFLNSNLTALGVESQRSHREVEGQEMIVSQIQSFIHSFSGVSLDEESINMIEYERAFQASSRVVGVVDEMLQSLMQM